MAICRATLGPDHPDTLRSINNYGSILDALGRSAEAEPYCREAMEKSRRVLGPDHPDTLSSMDIFIRRCRDLGMLKSAGEIAAERVRRRVRVFLDSAVRLDAGGQRALMGKMLLDVQDPGLSYEVGAALHAAEAGLGGEGRPDAAMSAWRQAALGWAWGRTAVAESRSARHRAQQAAAAADPEYLALVRQRDDARLRLSNGFWLGKPDWQARVEKDRQIVEQLEWDLSATSPAFRLGQDEGDVWIDEVATALGPHAATVDIVVYSPVVPAEPDDALGRKLIISIDRRYAAVILRQDEHGGPDIRVIDLGPVGPIDEAASSFRAAVNDYIALAKTGKVGQLNRGERLEALAEDEAQPGMMSETRASLPLRELHRLVWKPIANQLSGVTRVHASVDGDLTGVPLEALVTGRDADGRWRYLLESGPEIVYVTTGREAGRFPLRREFARTQHIEPGPAVAIGAPDFEATQEQLADAWRGLLAAGWPAEGVKLGALPPAPQDTVAALSQTVVTLGGAAIAEASKPEEWGDVDTLKPLLEDGLRALQNAGVPVAEPLLGDKAQEAVLLGRGGEPGRVDRPRVLLVATHGQVIPAEQVKAAAGNNPGRAELLQDPMMRSSLIFAGRNNAVAHGQEDGRLTAVEASGLSLMGTELVVLTACHGSEGQAMPGEGVSGLANAFLVAGASSVVASNWEVLAWHSMKQSADLYQAFTPSKTAAAEDPAHRRYAAFRAAELAALGRARDLARATDKDAAGILEVTENQVRHDRSCGLHTSAHPALWAAFTYHGDPGRLE